MITIMDGKQVANGVKQQMKEIVEVRKLKPKLAVIQVGDNKASSVYVRNKSKACSDVGIEFKDYKLPENISPNELVDLIKTLNSDDSVSGILLQQPVPKHLKGLERLIDVRKDVDGFTAESLGLMVRGDYGYTPCTTYGIFELLDNYRISVEGKHIVIVGRNNIVGKPTMLEMLNANATVTVCHSKTRNLAEITRTADILIVAIGKPAFITNTHIGDNTNVVIDVGINRLETGDLIGDCNHSAIMEKWNYLEKKGINTSDKYITPVPGGVGPMTIAGLIHNVVISTLK